MIVIHHLNNSRSQRILWLLEELKVPYEIKFYQRDATTNLAPPELKAVHPLGKSPVMTDGALTIAESGAIVDYLIRRHGDGRLAPKPGTDAHEKYLEWVHYAEGSGMLPLMLNLYTMRLGDAAAPLKPRIDSEIDNHLGYVNGALAGKDYMLGEFGGADVQMSFVGEVGRAFGRLGPHPNIAAWVERLHERPAFKTALEKGGAYNLA
ncbi:MAG TPA: glutathione S-transferase family protein [Caulobacteraceae bacterium]|nr:glutathione S-transferase family protein [Caulobacteraceae bacterium]